MLGRPAQSPAPSQLLAVKQALVDVSSRARRGIPVYVLVWGCLCVLERLWVSHPVVAFGNLLGLGLIAIARHWLAVVFPRLVEKNHKVAQASLTAMVLLNGAYWGVLTGISLSEPWGEGIWWIMAMVTTAMGAAGTMTMGINTQLRTGYPLSIFAPLILFAVLNPTQRNVGIAALSPVFFIYVRKASNVVYDDYWTALTGRLSAEDKARRMELLSNTDALTGLPNRMSFDKRFAEEWERAVRAGTSLAVLMIDLDHFKRLNDTYGHPFGDQCLEAAAAAFHGVVRSSADAVCRYGGEEFVALLPNTEALGAKATAERVLRKMREVRVANGELWIGITCSIGIASVSPTRGGDRGQLLLKADEALYRAKQQGRDQSCI